MRRGPRNSSPEQHARLQMGEADHSEPLIFRQGRAPASSTPPPVSPCVADAVPPSALFPNTTRLLRAANPKPSRHSARVDRYNPLRRRMLRHIPPEMGSFCTGARMEHSGTFWNIPAHTRSRRRPKSGIFGHSRASSGPRSSHPLVRGRGRRRHAPRAPHSPPPVRAWERKPARRDRESLKSPEKPRKTN